MAERQRTGVLAAAAAQVAFRTIVSEYHEDPRRVATHVSGDRVFR